jgi:hypothetical protein
MHGGKPTHPPKKPMNSIYMKGVAFIGFSLYSGSDVAEKLLIRL